MEAILSIHNIFKNFASQYTGHDGKEAREYAQLLNGINMEVLRGKIIAILGTNGSGKSTLFNIISGLLPPSEGNFKYLYNGRVYELTKLDAYQHARIGIARLFQGSNIFENLTILENMAVADNDRFGEQFWQILNPIRKKEIFRQQEAKNILFTLMGKKNPLWEKRNDLAGSLSIGQQRLLAFARLFMNEKAELYLLDEPCAGVNPELRKTMALMIKTLKSQGKTVVLIEHNLDFVEETCDDACYLEAGKILIQGTVNEVLNHQELKINYLGEGL